MEEKLDPWDVWTSPAVNDHMEGYFSLPLETLAALFVGTVTPVSEFTFPSLPPSQQTLTKKEVDLHMFI